MRRNVLFITRTFGTGFGGMQTQVSFLIEKLSQHPDVRLRVIAHQGGRLGLPFFFLRALCIALSTKTGTVHLGDALLTPLFPIIRVFRPRLWRTVTVHGLDVVWTPWAYQMLIRFSLRFAHKIAAVSQATADACRALGVKAATLCVIPCGIQIPETPCSRTSSPPVLLSLGRLVPRKGVTWFLEGVFPLLLARYPDMRLIIAGDGPELSRIRSLVALQKLHHSVDVLGSIPERAKEALFASATMLVMPNIPVFGDMEGFGITALEASSRGIPVVAADLEGLKDSVIDGVTGFHFLPLDLQSACIAIEKVLAKNWDMDEMRRIVRDKFDIGLIASRYVHDIF